MKTANMESLNTETMTGKANYYKKKHL